MEQSVDYGSALGSMIGGLISSAGQLYANHQNIKFQKSVNAMNAYIAAMNNATQIEMANTAHEREVKDLRRAGLNPILSAGGNGAPTPNLANARMDSAQVENPVAALGNSAAQIGRTLGKQAQLDLSQKQADLDYTDAVTRSAIIDNEVGLYRSNLEAYKTQIEQEALRDIMQGREILRDDGSTYITFSKDSEGYKLLKQGLEASLKDKSNINWRNNVDVMSRGINSAGNLLNLVVPRKARRIHP